MIGIRGDESLARHTSRNRRILGCEPNRSLLWIRPIVYFSGTKYLSQKTYTGDKYRLSALCLAGRAPGTDSAAGKQGPR